ncbi:PAS domain-containing protein [Cytobacillus citreus]|uniref:PAS domain-containing protein n=1 Tax=Cytobacillus citreus TaxID=2833586 RepID=UPI0020171C76|nr:PAS domain-containing protein [Cytobacillus citreus]
MEKLPELLTTELNSVHTSKKIEGIIFDIILNHIKDMVFIMKVESGKKFSYLFANEPGLKHANLTFDFIGKTLEEVLPFEIAYPLQKEYEKIIESKETVKFFDEISLPDGSKIAGESFLTPVFDENNEVRYVVSVTRDITSTLIERNA